jgi:acyl-CoA reductase-like NAD-dependent aldehyde dehydrogenase
VSVQRIYIHQELLSEFSQRFVAEVQRLKVGDPRAPETDCGPIIRERDILRLEETVTAAKAEGAKLLCGGERWGQTCFAPTVLQNAADQSRVMREEFFGPLAVLNPIQDLREGVQRANDNPWSFQAAVFSRDLPLTLQAVRGLNASAVMVNESTTFRVDWMPFRGDGPSGFGTGGIPFAMRDLVREKLVVIKDSAFEL